MAIKLSKRGQVDPFIVMDVMRKANEKAAGGHDIIHMEVGQPATAAPKRVLKAAKQGLDEDKIGYTDALGLPELRQKISEYYSSYYGCDVPVEQIVVTTGSSAAFLLSFLSAFEAGERVGLAAPGYPAYRNILKSINLEPVEIVVGAETGFQVTPEILDQIDPKLDGLILASPANPTGSMLSAHELENLCKYCEKQDIRFISDEIYHGITYENRATTAFPFSDKTIIINSFSKFFSMTGWRIGWMVVPKDMVRSIECLAQNMFISPPTLSQLGAIEAFDCLEELEKLVELYAKNRDMLLKELPKVGFTEFAPSDGAFYLYCDVSNLCEDAFAFCQEVLDKTGVAITPGLDFDSINGKKFVRFSYAGDYGRLLEATKRLADFHKG